MDGTILGLVNLTFGITKILAQTQPNYNTSGNAGLGIIQLFFGLAAYLFGSYCFQKIFQRLGMQDAWLAWVPIANTWMLLRAGDQSGWWIIALFIPLVNLFGLIVMIIAMVNIFKKLGKSPWMILLFLIPLVNFWLMYNLAFS